MISASPCVVDCVLIQCYAPGLMHAVFCAEPCCAAVLLLPAGPAPAAAPLPAASAGAPPSGTCCLRGVWCHSWLQCHPHRCGQCCCLSLCFTPRCTHCGTHAAVLYTCSHSRAAACLPACLLACLPACLFHHPSLHPPSSAPPPLLCTLPPPPPPTPRCLVCCPQQCQHLQAWEQQA
jgi:hypothetical protein